MNGNDNLDLKEYKSKETRLYGELMKICRSYSDELNLISVLGILDIVKQEIKDLDKTDKTFMKPKAPEMDTATEEEKKEFDTLI